MFVRNMIDFCAHEFVVKMKFTLYTLYRGVCVCVCVCVYVCDGVWERELDSMCVCISPCWLKIQIPWNPQT